MAIYDGIYAEVAFVVWRYESGGYFLQSVPGIVKRGKGYILRQVLLYGLGKQNWEKKITASPVLVKTF